jgi:glutamine synthetase
VTEKSKVLRDGFGDETLRSYLKLKLGEWHDYTGHLSDWERHNTLDC